MRSREEIKKDIKSGSCLDMGWINTEMLLDIRDILREFVTEWKKVE